MYGPHTLLFFHASWKSRGHTSDWQWPKTTRLLSVRYGECGTARSPWCRGRWVWLSRAPCSQGCSNPLTTPHFFQHSGQTIRSARRGHVLSRRDSRSSAQSHANRYQTPQPTRSTLYAFTVRCIHWHVLWRDLFTDICCMKSFSINKLLF